MISPKTATKPKETDTIYMKIFPKEDEKMKKAIAALLAVIMILSLASCKNEEPQEEIPEIKSELSAPEEIPEKEEEKTKEELYEEIILNFGAKKGEDGIIRINKTVSLYNLTDGFEDGKKLDENSYFSWAMFYFNKEYSHEERLELFSGAGENMGWAYPSEYYEPAIFEYFGVPAEELRKGELYNAEKDYYHIGGGGGVGISPAIIIRDIEEKGENIVFHITLDSDIEGWEVFDMVLTAKLLPEGGYNYISYLPDEKPKEEEASAVFAVGKNGEGKELSVGDTIGEWVLAELSVQYDESGEMTRVRAHFDGKASFEGYIERNVLLEEAYDFCLNESDIERMPYLVSEEFGTGASSHYLLDMPEDFGKKPNLDWEETANAKVSITGITINYAFTMTADRFEVSDIEIESKGILPRYEEMLINFGAEKGKNGNFYPADSFCDTFAPKGFSDTKSISDYFYYIWYFNHMHRLGISQEELEKTFASPFGENTGWAYPAEYFEPAAEKFFGVKAEELRKRDFYYEEYDCYYIHTGAPGKGEIPEIIINDISEAGEMVIFDITVDYSVQEDYDMTLTVKQLFDENGGYNYVSFTKG